MVEVHSPEPGGKTVYHCVLCGEGIDGMVRMVQHLHKLSHKLHYLVSRAKWSMEHGKVI